MAADDQSDRSFARPRGPIPIRPAPPRPTGTQLADAVLSLVPAVRQLDSEMVELLAQSHALDALFRRNLSVLDAHEQVLGQHGKLLARFAALLDGYEQRLRSAVRDEVRDKMPSREEIVADVVHGVSGAIDEVRDHAIDAIDEVKSNPGIGFEEVQRVSRTPSDPAMAARKVGLGVVILAARGAWSSLRFVWRGTKHVLGPAIGALLVGWLVNFAYQHHWIKAPPEQVLGAPESSVHPK